MCNHHPYPMACVLALSPLLISGLLFASAASAQVEQEPNDPCPVAQVLHPAPLPLSFAGNLDSSARPDVDFYKIRTTPGTRVSVSLQGAQSGNGTLDDPYLGIFDSSCNLLASNDDYDSLDSRVDWTVPANGYLIVGATECCDGAFEGGGNGSYRVTVDYSTTIDSISGRLVDAVTGAPLSGYYPTDARAELRLCYTTDCSSYDTVAYDYLDDTGVFRFVNGYYGALDAGRYEVSATAQGYTSAIAGPFDVAAAQAYDTGDIALAPIPTIASIGGRVVDAVTGEPLVELSGYVNISLLQCEDAGYCDYLGNAYLDADSRFLFTRGYNGLPLPIGNYEVQIYADQYDEVTTPTFAVGEGESYDTGDIGLHALTIGFSDVVPCKRVPREGGVCNFSVKVSNRLTNRLFGGRAWVLVDGSSVGSVLDYTTYQLSQIAQVNLQSGETKVIQFSFRVPTTVDNGAYICARIYAGESTPNAYYGTVGQDDLFCINKGTGPTYSVLPPAQARAQFDRIHGRTNPRAPMPRQ